MMGFFALLITLFTALASLSALAQPDAETENDSIRETAQVPSSAKILGNLDFRPSWSPGAGKLAAENSAELGYQFSAGRSLSWVQEFDVSLINPSLPQNALQPVPILRSGALRVAFEDFTSLPVSRLSLSYEGRLFGPVSNEERASGMIAAFRSYLKVKREVTPSVSLSLTDLPIFFAYRQTGYLAEGTPKANPGFENRIYLAAEIALTDALQLSLPLQFYLTRYKNFSPAAELNDSWGGNLIFYPELNYLLNDNFTVGAAYYSDNLILPDFSGTAIPAGLTSGVFQLILAASL